MSLPDTITSLGTAIINLIDRKFSTKASTSQFGVVKIGSGLSVTNGVVSNAGGTVDSAMSSTSTNPVQNKVVYSALSDKVNTSSLSEVTCVVETYVNGDSWYRIWSDGWCEQGGMILATSTNNTTVNLLQAYRDTTYHILFGNMYKAAVATATCILSAPSKTINSFIVYDSTDVNFYTYWRTCGYLY